MAHFPRPITSATSMACTPMSKPCPLQNAQFAVVPRAARCVRFLLPLSCAATNWITDNLVLPPRPERTT